MYRRLMWFSAGILIILALAIFLSMPREKKSQESPNTPSLSFNFEEEGYLIGAPQAWQLIYEEPGAPGLTVKLLVGANSHCERNGTARNCEELLSGPGNRIRVEGNRSSDIVTVNRIIGL